MKAIRSVLLGSAVGLVTVVSAQAADMAVKAAPVKFVSLCSEFGAGFYQVPGKDSCLSIGGTVRLDLGINADGNGGPFVSGAPGVDDNSGGNDIMIHGRGTAWIDYRQMTGWGPANFFLSAAAEGSGGPGGSTSQASIYVKRGFVQWAGFTLGKNQSFFDFHNGDFSYGAYHFGGGSNTYDFGTLLAAYSYKFGPGFTASVAAEDSNTRRNALWDAGTDGLAAGRFPGPNTLYGMPGLYPNCTPGPNTTGIHPTCGEGDYSANYVPDIVGSLRVDQAWGGAQVAAALHDVRAGFYGNDNPGITTGPGQFTGVAPGDKWGHAVMAGLELNVPTGKGDKVWAEGVYTQGALAYTGLSQIGSFGNFAVFKGNGTAAAAWALDGMFANGVGPASVGAQNFSGMQLTTAWSLGGAYEHNWIPMLRSSVFGSLTKVSYSDQAKMIFCEAPVGPVRTAAGAAPNFATGPVIGCNPDFNVWAVGTRTVWNPMPNMDLGFEVMYSKIHQNMDPNFVRINFAGDGNRAAGLYTPADMSTWSGLIRFQYHFGAPPPSESRS